MQLTISRRMMGIPAPEGIVQLHIHLKHQLLVRSPLFAVIGQTERYCHDGSSFSIGRAASKKKSRSCLSRLVRLDALQPNQANVRGWSLTVHFSHAPETADRSSHRKTDLSLPNLALRSVTRRTRKNSRVLLDAARDCSVHRRTLSTFMLAYRTWCAHATALLACDRRC